MNDVFKNCLYQHFDHFSSWKILNRKCLRLPLVDDAWVEVHLNWVFGLFPRTMTAVDDGGNHFTTNVLLIFDPLVKANLKWQLECPALLITTPAILWVAIDDLGNCVKIPFRKMFYHNQDNLIRLFKKNVFFCFRILIRTIGVCSLKLLVDFRVIFTRH